MNKKNKNNSPVSIKEIAKEADVSIATVSNVINKSYKVREKTKKKVETVIKKHNYRINIGASSLRTKVSKLIGVIVTEISNPLFSNLNDEIEKYARQFNYSIVICDNHYDYNQDIENIEVLASRNVDGLIMVPSIEDKKVLLPAIKHDIPVVLVHRKIEDSNCDVVTVDNYKASYDVVNYLVSLGHKKIVYTNEEPELDLGQLKFKGFVDGMKNNGLDINKDLIIQAGNFEFNDGYKFIDKVLKLKERPTAIIAYTDMMAIGMIKALYDLGFKVPEDYSIIGFDNINIDNYLVIGLTSVGYEIEETARSAVQLLMERIKCRNRPPKMILLPTSIKKRDSVGIARKE